MREKIINKHVGSVNLFSLLLIWNERLLRGRKWGKCSSWNTPNQPVAFTWSATEKKNDKGKGMNAVEKIRENMSAREFNPLPSPEQIIEKMNGLRTYFNTQRNKLASSKSSGAGTNTVYKIWWQFYEPLSFLLDMVTPRKTISNLEETHSLLPPSCPNSTKKIRS